MLQIVAMIVFLFGSPDADGSPRHAVALEEDLADGPWPGFRQNASHTGRTSMSGPLHPLKAWTYDMGGSTYSSPAVGENGTVFIGSADSVYAVAPDGRRRWATSIGGYAISSPAIGADGTIYVGSRDRKVYALLPQDGRFKWTPFEAGDEIWTSPNIGPDGTIVVGSFDGNLYALDPSTGTERWTVTIGAELIASPAIGRDGTIYVAALDGRLYAIDPQGFARWSYSTGGDVVSSPAIGADGTIYVGSLDGNLYAVRPNGAEQWAVPFRTNGRIVSSPAIGANGTIYVGSLDGNLYAVGPDGTRLWAFEADSQVISSPAVDAQGIIYFGSYGGWLYAVFPDGTPRWSLDLAARIWSSPAIGSDRTLYVASTDAPPFTGQLHSIRSVAFDVSFRTNPVDGVAQVVDVTEPEEFAPTSGQLFYRRGGERTYRTAVPLRVAAAGFEGDIPADDVTMRGIEYYVRLTDGRTTATYPPVEPQIRPAVQTVRIQQSVTADLGLPSAGYAMISVPLVLDDPTVEGVLADDYGPYAPSNWRLLRWEGGAYREHPAMAAAFTPGAAFFLTVRDGRSFDVDGGQAVDLSTPFRITLQPGWNQVANPFAFPVSLDDVRRDASVVRTIAYWDGTEMCQESSCIDVWQPWEGYFVLNVSEEPVSIFVRPVEASEPDEPPDEGEDAASADEPLMRLVARVPGTSLMDSQNWIGFSRDATAKRTSDVMEAPPFGEHVRLSIMDGGSRYARRMQPLSTDGGRWDLELALPDNDARQVELTVIEEQTLPEGFGVSVLDRDFGEVIPIVDGRFTVSLGRDHEPRSLTVFVGTNAFRETELGETPARALTFTLDQNYPNPFRSETVIGYQTARAGRVVVTVFDVTGRRVRTLVNDVQEAGYHKAAWDGRSETGERVASGMYLYRVTSGSTTRTKKMSILR